MSLTFVPQIVAVPPGSPSGSLNCNSAAAAVMVAHATGGAKRPTASDVRALCRNPDGSPDRSGGTTLRQNADGIKHGFDVDMEVCTPDSFAVFERRMKADRTLAASISIWYGALLGTPAYASRSGFMGNHQGAVQYVGGQRPWELTESLADGKRGVPHAPVRITGPQLRRAAALLILSPATGRRLGDGLVYVGYVRGLAAPKPVKFSVKFTAGASFWLYGVQGGVAIQRTSKRFAKATSARCDAPRWITFGAERRKLAKVTAGKLAGQFVEPGRSGVGLVAS